MKCPRCGSPHVTSRHAGELAGDKIGALFGAAFGAASAMRGARVGVLIGSRFGPVGAAAGGITGAVFAGVFMGSIAAGIGSALGHVFDREVLCDAECQRCGQVFRSAEVIIESSPAASAGSEQAPAPLSDEPGAARPFFTPKVD